MLKVQDILKLKTLILAMGLLVAVAIISGPVLKDYVQSTSIKCEQSEKQEDKEPQSQVSSLEAVAPVLQSNFDFEDILLEVLTIEYNTLQKNTPNYIAEIPQKFLKVLFRWIIAPNAP